MHDLKAVTTVREFCLSILQRGDLQTKLTPPRTDTGDWWPDLNPGPPLMLDAPARDPELAMGSGTERLPRLNELGDPAARAQCLERFANHELMAIELFAWALLAFPELPRALRRGFLRVLEEEQIHLRLYLDRLENLGGKFGQTALGDYFWQQVPALRASEHGPKAFLAAMGLTFEQANLDYSLLYRDAFRAAGDLQSAQVIDRVHRDEVGHVRMAAVWLRRLGGAGRSDVELYQEAIPFPLSAARAKARRFDVESRRRAGLSDEMIEFVQRAVPYARKTAGEASRTTTLESDAGTDAGAAFALTLFANVGGEEDRRKAKGAPKIEPVGALWLLALGLGGASRVVIPEEREVRQRNLHSDAAPGSPLLQRLHPALRDWLAAHPDPSPILTALAEHRRGSTWRDQGSAGASDRPSQDGIGMHGGDIRGDLLPWLSTEASLRYAREARWRYLGPDPQIVRRVHDKAFAVQFASRSGSTFRRRLTAGNDVASQCVAVLDPSELRDRDRGSERVESIVASWPDFLRASFTLKPRFGTSGRGRVWGAHGKLPPASIQALSRLAERGGAVLEPWLHRVHDLSVQLLIRSPEQIEILGSTEQIVTPSGGYLGNRGEVRSKEDAAMEGADESADTPSDSASDPPRHPHGRVDLRSEDPVARATPFDLESGHPAEARLRDAALAIARHAAIEGLYGPCGVDSFTYRNEEGNEQLRPVVEFNARMTLGIIALAAVRAALDISGMRATRWEFRLEGVRRGETRAPAPAEGNWLYALPLLVDQPGGPIVRLS